MSQSIFPKEKPKKVRKSNAIRGKYPLDFNFEDPELVKNIELSVRNCGGKSQKKSYFYLAASNLQNPKEFPTSVGKISLTMD